MKYTQTHIANIVVTLALTLTMAGPAWATGADNGRRGLRTVCIDPGHGGNDPGCVSRDKKTHESKIALDISKRLNRMITEGYPSVKVVMTRSTDVFIPLDKRAEIANKNDANLFISIHVNMVSNTSPNGYSIHVLGQSSHKDRDLFAYNMNVCRRENSVIMLEDGYSEKYQGFDPSDPESFIFFNLMQNAHLEQSLLFAQDVEHAMNAGPIKKSRGIWQDPFFVLWKTSMPAVLIEVGFMSNAGDLAVLRTEEGRNKIAEDIYNAFKVFKKRYDGSVNAGTPEEVAVTKAEPAPKTAEKVAQAPVKTGKVYGVQVLASAKDMKDTDPFFKGYKPMKIKSGSLYKYIIGVSDTKSKTEVEYGKIRKSFAGSFIVAVDGDVITRIK